MVPTPEPDTDIELVGGALCLDFANTRRMRRQAEPREHLQEYADLLRFAAMTGVVDVALGQRLHAAAAQQPAAAAAALDEAKNVREAIYSFWLAQALAQPLAATDLATINAALGRALAQRRVLELNGEFVWGWNEADLDFERPLWPLVLSAGELLVSGQSEHVRKCAADTCGVIFVDTSRSQRRRWCSMQTCGNRDKVRRFRTRGGA